MIFKIDINYYIYKDGYNDDNRDHHDRGEMKSI